MKTAVCCHRPRARRPVTAFTTLATSRPSLSSTFIRRARALDLPLNDIGTVLDLRRGGTIPCTRVRHLLDARIAEVDQAITELQALRATLATTRQATVTAPEPGAGICPIIER
jgi:MerR family transcriptional regulator, copper efflux regulator